MKKRESKIWVIEWLLAVYVNMQSNNFQLQDCAVLTGREIVKRDKLSCNLHLHFWTDLSVETH